MGKLIITPEILALQAEREALEKRKEQDRVPPRVAAFWFAEEATIPPWRPIESAEEREQRDEAQSRGCWPG